MLLLLLVLNPPLCTRGVALSPGGVLGRTWRPLPIPILTRILASILSLPMTEAWALRMVLCPEFGVMRGSGSRPTWAVWDLGTWSAACWGQHVIGVRRLMLHWGGPWCILWSQQCTCNQKPNTLYSLLMTLLTSVINSLSRINTRCLSHKQLVIPTLFTHALIALPIQSASLEVCFTRVSLHVYKDVMHTEATNSRTCAFLVCTPASWYAHIQAGCNTPMRRGIGVFKDCSSFTLMTTLVIKGHMSVCLQHK